MNIFDLKIEEEKRRNNHFTPLQRWVAIQNAISWADAQQKEPRNTRLNRLKEQAKKNTFIEEFKRLNLR